MSLRRETYAQKKIKSYLVSLLSFQEGIRIFSGYVFFWDTCPFFVLTPEKKLPLSISCKGRDTIWYPLFCEKIKGVAFTRKKSYLLSFQEGIRLLSLFSKYVKSPFFRDTYPFFVPTPEKRLPLSISCKGYMHFAKG